VIPEQAPGQIKRNMPSPIPVMVLGRLAVAIDFQGQGLGRALLKDAVLRTINVSQQVGIRALLAHALTPSAKVFYERHGFLVSPLEPMTLMLPLPKHNVASSRV
jgi:predicted N-acetyltransferase YhbS